MLKKTGTQHQHARQTPLRAGAVGSHVGGYVRYVRVCLHVLNSSENWVPRLHIKTLGSIKRQIK